MDVKMDQRRFARTSMKPMAWQLSGKTSPSVCLVELGSKTYQYQPFLWAIIRPSMLFLNSYSRTSQSNARITSPRATRYDIVPARKKMAMTATILSRWVK